MPSCVASIKSKIDTNQLDTITELTPNTLMPISITISQKQLFSLEIIQQESVKFTINLVSGISPTNVGVTVSIYQINGNSILLHGSVLITEMNLSFQKDFTEGLYIICIGSSSISYTGTFLGEFSSYQIYKKLSPSGFAGQSIPPFELSFAYVEKECNKLLYYSLIDGKLPEGIQMTLTGDLYGILPNLDCTNDTDKLSPSQNWYFDMNETWQPWGNQWRFKLRVWIADFPNVFKEDWFCIRIHNNWSWDRDNKPPIEYEEETIEIIEKEPFPNLCCEEEEKEIFKPKPLPVTMCPCDEETSSENKTVLNFLQWYKDTIENPVTDNPHIEEFIDNFRKTSYFSEMMKKAGLEESTLSFEEKEINALKILIDYYNSLLVDGYRRENDIDYIMLNLKYQENQKLPMTLITTFGTNLSITLET